MSQTSRDRVNSYRVVYELTKRTHEKHVRRLGTIIQSIFCAQSGASIHLTFWKWSGDSRRESQLFYSTQVYLTYLKYDLRFSVSFFPALEFRRKLKMRSAKQTL